jgi:hypothetical protein
MGISSTKLAIAFATIAVCRTFNRTQISFSVAFASLASIAWFRAFNIDLLSRVTVTRKIDTVIDRQEVRAFPESLCTTNDVWVASLERATKVIPREKLLDDVNGLDGLLVRYLGANMKSFSRTPQCWIFWLLCTGEAGKKSFDERYLENLSFKVGDLVCGVFRVAVRHEDRIELIVDPDKSLRRFGEAKAIIAAKISEDDDGKNVTFVNGEWYFRLRWSYGANMI